MFEYDKDAEAAIDTLDQYDFSVEIQTLRENRAELCDVREKLSRKSETVEEAIDNLTDDEFLEYLHVRYRVPYAEKKVTYIY